MVDQLETRVLGHSFDIGAFVVVVVADALGFVPLTQTLFLVPLIWILLRMRHERWSTIGFSLPDDLARSIVVGIDRWRADGAARRLRDHARHQRLLRRGAR